MMRASVACVTLILFVHFQNLNIWTAAAVTKPVCQTEDCKTLGTLYRAHTNNQVSPCTNFYNYVCGNWGIQNPRPKSADIWGVENVMGQNGFLKLKQLLEDTSPTSNLDFRHAKVLYGACMQLAYRPKSYPEDIKEFIAKVGNWPMFLPKNTEVKADVSWSAIDNLYIQETAESALFDVALGIAVDGEDNYIITEFKKMESPYGTIIRTGNWGGGLLSSEKGHYKNLLTKIVQSVAPGDPKAFKSVIDKDLSNVIKFRDQIREINDKLAAKVFEVMKIKDLQTWYNKLAQASDSAQIDWMKKVRAFYKKVDANGHAITDETMVNVQKLYISKLVELLKTTPKRVIINHIHLYFAERHLILSPDAEKELHQSIKKETYPIGAIRHEKPRWKKCIEDHNMEVTLRKMYITAVATPEAKAEAQKLIDETKKLMKQQISEATWLDKATKDKSIEKIAHVTSSVGNPVWVNESRAKELNSAVATENPLQPDVYFNVPANELYISTAYFQLPRFSPSVPYVIQYGATVFAFGHELYHSLDRELLEYSLNGKKFWSDPMLSKLSDQLKCFQDQYNAKRNQELGTVARMVLKIPQTVDEDVADVMGAKLAYRGFKQLLQQRNGTCPTLPGFENMDCEKLFFIALGNTFCSDSSPSAVTELLLTDTHSSSHTRVNGIAANLKEFATAFGCSAKDKMTSQKTCDLWKG